MTTPPPPGQPRRSMWAFLAILVALLAALWLCWWGATRVLWDDCTDRGGHAEPVYGTAGWTCAGAKSP